MASKRHGVRVGILWTIGAGAVIALVTNLSRPAVVILCVVGGLAFTLLLAEYGWLWKAPPTLSQPLQPFGKLLRATILVTFVCAVMVAIGIAVYPPIRRHTLSPDEREEFKTFLKDKADTKYQIQIACPMDDEKTCAYATQFLDLFGESGWKVNPFIQRVMLSKSLEGVSVRLRGGNKEYMMQHWDAGAYFPINEIHVLAVHSAFESIAIEIDGSSDPDLPEAEMMIYFGPERENEAEPTQLSRDIDWVTGKITGPFPTPPRR